MALLCLSAALLWPVYGIRKAALSSLNQLITSDGLYFSSRLLENLYNYVVSGNGDKVGTCIC